PRLPPALRRCGLEASPARLGRRPGLVHLPAGLVAGLAALGLGVLAPGADLAPPVVEGGMGLVDIGLLLRLEPAAVGPAAVGEEDMARWLLRGPCVQGQQHPD